MNLIFICASALVASSSWAGLPVVTVGSKVFTESYVLAEIISQVIEAEGEATVDRRFGLGGTGIVVEALKSGAIDIYPEYTGTILESVLKRAKDQTIVEIQTALGSSGFLISGSLGFNNTYALAVRESFARANQLSSISDLRQLPQIKTGFSHEFSSRADGLPGLIQKYGLRFDHLNPLSHGLAYEAIARDDIEITDAYSTDAKIEKLNLRVLEDDQHFFPDYWAVWMTRKAFAERFPRSWKALKRFEGGITQQEVIRLNASVEIQKKSFGEVARLFLTKHKLEPQAVSRPWEGLWPLTTQHLSLVGISLLFSVLFGLPLGIIAARFEWLGRSILTASGVIQTIPSLALLCFLIPLFGIGTQPALVALILYGLLPIVSGVHTGLMSIDPRLIDSARALGLSSWARLIRIELPLASRSILAGMKTSAIIGIGTATLAALIGAGGYGTLIVTGLALNDMATILRGAIPSALMALGAEVFFTVLSRILIPRGLR